MYPAQRLPPRKPGRGRSRGIERETRRELAAAGRRARGWSCGRCGGSGCFAAASAASAAAAATPRTPAPPSRRQSRGAASDRQPPSGYRARAALCLFPGRPFPSRVWTGAGAGGVTESRHSWWSPGPQFGDRFGLSEKFASNFSLRSTRGSSPLPGLTKTWDVPGKICRRGSIG